MNQKPTTAPESPVAGAEPTPGIPTTEPGPEGRLEALAGQVEALLAAKGGLTAPEHLMLLEDWATQAFGMIFSTVLELVESVHRLADTVARLIDPDDDGKRPAPDLEAEADKMMTRLQALRLLGAIGYLESKPPTSRLLIPLKDRPSAP